MTDSASPHVMAGMTVADVDAAAINKEQTIFAAKVKILYHQSYPLVLISPVAYLLLAGLLWQAVNHTHIVVWVAAMLAISAWCLRLTLRYRSEKPASDNSRPWYIRQMVVIFVNCLGWGLAGALLFPSGSIAHQAYLIIFLAMLSNAVLSLYSVFRPAFLVAITGLMTPIILRLFMEQNISATLISVGLLLFSVLMVMYMRHTNLAIVTTLELRFENDSLLNYLTDSKIEVESLNKWLLSEIQQRRQALEELEHSRSLLRSTLESTADGIMATDMVGRVISYNRRFIDFWRLGNDMDVEDPQKNVLRLARRLKFPGEYIAWVKELENLPEKTGFQTLALRDGRIFEVFTHPQRLDGTIVGRVWSVRDITAHARDQEQFQFMALHDQLTSTANRPLLTDCLAKALGHAKRRKRLVALLAIDVDRFKSVNDQHGYGAGDLILIEIANRLKQIVRETDTVARIGDDEFVVLLEDIGTTQDIRRIAETVLNKLREPMRCEGTECTITVSIGIAIYPDHGQNTKSLLTVADEAMHEAKKDGGDRMVYVTRTHPAIALSIND